MTGSNPLMDPTVRDHLLSDPGVLLEDRDLMQALVAAREGARGANVIDLRGVAMQRLSDRLDRLEETHQGVVAAAYQNLAGIEVIHRAILDLLGATEAGRFLDDLAGPVAAALRVDALRLVLETTGPDDLAHALPDHEILGLAEHGYCSLYAGPGDGGAPRRVTLRRLAHGDAAMHGPVAPSIRSEACLLLDVAGRGAPGLLVLGACDPAQFAPGQGTDLLGFFAEVFARVLGRWVR